MGGKAIKTRLVSRLQWLVVIVLRWAPVFLLLYAIFVHFGFFIHSPLIDRGSLVPFYIAGGTLLFGFAANWAIRSSRMTFALYIMLYQLFVLAYLYLVSGILSLPVMVFTLLYIIGYMWVGRSAAIVSVSAFFSFAILGSLIWPNITESLIQNLTTATVLIALGSLLTIAFNDIDRSQNEVLESKQKIVDQQNRMSTLINNIADAIVSTNISGEISAYNAAFINLLDTNANLEDAPINDILVLHDTSGQKISMLDVIYDSSAVKVRDDLTAIISGEEIRLEITSSAIRSAYQGEGEQASQHSGYIIILRDVTKSKSLEEERDEFISVVSHELRTPITIAEGTLSNTELMMQRDDIAKDKLIQNVTLAHNQIVFLAKMVNDLSTLSRAERGVADTVEEIDVAEMIHDLYNEYQPQAAERGLGFDIHMPGKPGFVSASRLYLKELLQNFVTNAIKYTHEGSVTVTVKHQDGHIVFAIKDSGIGISKSDQKRIFEKFYRAEDYRTRETSGTGLGLYVAEKLAHKIGATIDLKSRLNHGSTFSISLPSTKPSAK